MADLASRHGETYLLLREIIWKVGNHDLVLGWNAISRWATLTTITTTGSAVCSWLGLLAFLGLLVFGGLVGGLGQGEDISRWDLCTFLAAGLLIISIGKT